MNSSLVTSLVDKRVRLKPQAAEAFKNYTHDMYFVIRAAYLEEGGGTTKLKAFIVSVDTGMTFVVEATDLRID